VRSGCLLGELHSDMRSISAQPAIYHAGGGMINTHPSPVSPLVTARLQFDEVRVAQATVKAALSVSSLVS